MSYPLVIRLMIAMGLMPDASYCEALARLAGLLADIPFTLDWHMPTEKVITEWRLPVPADVMESMFWRAAGPLLAGERAVCGAAGRDDGVAADGMLVNIADTEANRRRSARPGPRMIPRRSRSCGWSRSPPGRAARCWARSWAGPPPGSRPC